MLLVLAAIALATASAPPMSPRGVALVLVGALLFFVSDIAVAKARFVERRFIDRLWGLPSYYAGQLCIAWSLLA